MREQFERLIERFDALPLRERRLLFAGVLIAFAFLFYLLALEPVLATKKRLSQQVGESRKTIATLQELKTQVPDPAAVRRAERDALRKQLADIDKTMGQVQRGLVPPERMGRLLEEVLRGGSGLQLVSLRTLPVQRFDPRGTALAEAAPGPNEAERQLYQHGFEITVQGSYAEVHDYLRRVEQLPWRLFWNQLALSADAQQHPKLSVTIRVQTLSLSKAWLTV
jgi:MSHA biogenesis protein MshJ